MEGNHGETDQQQCGENQSKRMERDNSRDGDKRKNPDEEEIPVCT